MILADNMDPTLVLILVIFVAAILFGCLFTLIAGKKRNQQLAHLAKKYGGVIESGGLVGLSKMRFPHAGRTVLLTYRSRAGENHSYTTSLTIPWVNGKLRCEIFPESPVSALRKLIGMQDIEIGSRRFDDQFVITGNDEAAIKALLTPDVQLLIGRLYKLKAKHGWVDHVYLHISGGSLTVTKNEYLASLAELEPFIQLFLDLFDAAAHISAAGIEFLGAVSVQSADASGEAVPHCIVCGEALRTDLVSCRSCRTPHHKDCWQYFGGCATYACGGKQFVPAKASGGR